MGNIFEGYEDKTTEELAAELGISESSVVDNTEKETIDILESDSEIINNNILDLKTLLGGFLTITCEHIQVIEQLKIGKVVISSKGEVGIISFLNSKKSSFAIYISFFDKKGVKFTKKIFSFEELQRGYQISKDHIINNYIPSKPTNIGELQEGIIVKHGDKPFEILGKIVFLSETTNTITIRLLHSHNNSNNDCDFENFIKEYSIYTKSEILTNDFVFGNLQRGMKLHSIEDSNKTATINKTNSKNWEITILEDDTGIESTLLFDEIKSKFLLPIIEKDWNNQNKRILLKDIEKLYGELSDDIVENDYIHYKQGDSFESAIGKVHTNFQTTKEFNVVFPFGSEKWSFASFKNNFAMHKNDFAKYLLQDSEGKTAKEITDISDIQLEDEVINLYGKDNDLIWEVSNIGPGQLATQKDDVTLYNGETWKVVKFKNLKTNFQIIREKKKKSKEEKEVKEVKLKKKKQRVGSRQYYQDKDRKRAKQRAGQKMRKKAKENSYILKSGYKKQSKK